jgi:nucleoside-diphosphate-sugar epimerase
VNCTIQKAVVTGASGFLGNGLVQKLCVAGVEVLGVDLHPARSCIDGYKHIQGTISNSGNAIRVFLSDGGAFFHMAGFADAGICEQNPMKAFEINLGSVEEALQLCRTLSHVSFVLPSTGILYGNRSSIAVAEESSVQVGGVYAGSKLAAEVLVRLYARETGHDAVIARLSNVYGPDSGENTVVGRLLGQVRNQDALEVLDTKPIRDFIYVEDVIEALVRCAMLKAGFGLQTVNVSTGVGTRIGELIRILVQLSGLASRVVLDPEGEPESVDSLVMKNETLERLTGWCPAISVEEGLKRCLEIQTMRL